MLNRKSILGGNYIEKRKSSTYAIDSVHLFLFISDEQDELTDEKLFNLSQQFTDYNHLLTLAVTGLRMSNPRVMKHINNHKDNITQVAHKLLIEWRNEQPNRRKARAEIVKALENSSLQLFITECKL